MPTNDKLQHLNAFQKTIHLFLHITSIVISFLLPNCYLIELCTMKSKLFLLLLISLYCTNGVVRYDDYPHGKEEELPKLQPTPSTTTTTSSASNNNYLDNISIQDVLSSDIDSSEKIEKKIINTVTEYSTNCQAFKKIRLSTDGFLFTPNPITVDLDAARVIFYNFSLNDSSKNTSEKKSYSSVIGCDSSRKAKIEVKLPTNITISANLKITKITNSSSIFQPVSDVLDEGLMTFTLTHNNVLSKQVSIKTNNSLNYEDDITWKILYTTSQVSLNIETKFQMAIYKHLQTWFDRVELPIRQYLAEKLDAELKSNGIFVADSCSKFITPEKNLKKTNLPFINNNFNNLYVIPNAKLETWKGVALSAGPILIEGLSSFNTTELIVLESESSTLGDEYRGEFNDDRYFRNIPSSDDSGINATTVRIKTNDLKGKLDWSYNSKQRSFTFTLEYIQFEVQKSKSINYTKNQDNVYLYRRHYGNEHYSPGSLYVKSNENKVDVNVYLGNLQIKSSKSNVCENENEFVHFVLSEYLKTVIADSLKNSLSKKILNDSLFAHCF